MTIMLLVSTFVYKGVVTTSKRALTMHERKVEIGLQKYRNRDPLSPPLGFQKPITEETIKEIRAEILLLLGIVNGTILVITGGLSYVFAGITLKPIQEMVAKQKKFVSDAAHELKTPLTSIKTSLEVNLRNKKLSIKQSRKLIEKTIDSVDDLNKLANSLLKDSRYQHNDLNKTDEVDIEKMVKKVIKKMEKRIKEKNIDLSLKTKESAHIKGNERAVEELITILLDNAIKFNERLGEILITIGNEKDNLVLKITNTGSGISKKDLPFIFDRFYKSEKSRTKKENDGFGLGLSIAREIVMVHNGTIEATSENTGNPLTTFTIKFPKK